MKQKAIVKVQISLMTTKSKPQVLVYTKHQKHYYQGDATKEIIKEMDGEPKKFFYALVPKDKPGEIELQGEAPWQDW